MTSCQCGHLKTEGNGSSKKLSKKRAAEQMVVELKNLPPLSPPPPSAKPKKIVMKPKQTKNLIKVTAAHTFCLCYQFSKNTYAVERNETLRTHSCWHSPQIYHLRFSTDVMLSFL